MLRSEVTMGQYAACVADGACGEPLPDPYEPPDFPDFEGYYTWGDTSKTDHPVNGVDWYQAVEFCQWAGGRLPSEAEWEYAARSLGQDRTYPWGEAEPACEYAVMGPAGSEIGPGCGEERTWDVCSKPAGNTDQGLCDMAGNVWEWVQDCYHSDYENAPADGSAWEDECDQGSDAVARGGGYKLGTGSHLECRNRTHGAIDNWATHLGFRCVQ
ncbi:MAG: formylglycine-generating enzyme family protein [Polyangia bacterium]